jgi:hypothetical protein
VLPADADVEIEGAGEGERTVSALDGGPLAIGGYDETLARWGGAVWLFDVP